MAQKVFLLSLTVSDANLMHSLHVRKLVLQTFRTTKPLEVLAVDGSVMGRVTRHTQTVTLRLSDFLTIYIYIDLTQQQL